MKSSTIRRSNLSKEKIAVLEALSKFNSSNENNNVIKDSGINTEPMEDSTPEVYVRRNKEKELDILWKDFKMPKGESSPIVFLGIGFISGIIATLVVSAIIGMSSGNANPEYTAQKSEEVVSSVNLPDDASVENITEQTAVNAPAEQEENTEEVKPKKFGFFSSNKNKSEVVEEPPVQENKEYEVQSGDTMEKIVKSFYGKYSEEGVNTIMKANNMTNPNKLSIGQKLIIPSAPTVSAE